MMKKILILLSMLVIALFIVGCAQKELTDSEEEALEEELTQMSDEELNQVIDSAETDDAQALSGQAFQTYSKYSSSTLLKTAYKVKASKYATLISSTNFKEPLNSEFCIDGYFFVSDVKGTGCAFPIGNGYDESGSYTYVGSGYACVPVNQNVSSPTELQDHPNACKSSNSRWEGQSFSKIYCCAYVNNN
jgi:hypothetical protein